MLYMVTFTINIPPMLAYIPAPWILWELERFFQNHRGSPCLQGVDDVATSIKALAVRGTEELRSDE